MKGLFIGLLVILATQGFAQDCKVSGVSENSKLAKVLSRKGYIPSVGPSSYTIEESYGMVDNSILPQGVEYTISLRDNLNGQIVTSGTGENLEVITSVLNPSLVTLEEKKARALKKALKAFSRSLERCR